jgi:hypothetical protein
MVKVAVRWRVNAKKTSALTDPLSMNQHLSSAVANPQPASEDTGLLDAIIPHASFSDAVNQEKVIQHQAGADVLDEDIWQIMYGESIDDGLDQLQHQAIMEDELQEIINGGSESIDKKIMDKSSYQMKMSIANSALHSTSNFTGHHLTTSTRSHEDSQWWGSN